MTMKFSSNEHYLTGIKYNENQIDKKVFISTMPTLFKQIAWIYQFNTFLIYSTVTDLAKLRG